jgi:hypothetical protein
MATKKHKMHKRFLSFLCFFVAVTLSGQAISFDGTWYGAINPPGAKFDVAVNVQKRGDVWTGTLLTEDGTSFPLTDISVQGNTITFAVSPGASKVTFTGTLSGATPAITGEFKQDNATFPFSLSRTPTAAFQGAAVALDPNELISMMTTFSGPASERPFVPPVTHPAIEYGIRPRRDPVANLQRDIQEGKVQLKFEGEDGYLRSVLETLRIPVESQMAVFSKNSLQSAMITPENPRILYFNDSVAVASVRGGFIEMASQDPEQGINFYMLPQQPAGKPFIIQRDECLRCHHSRNSLDIPGMLLRSVYPTAAGAPINQLGSHLLDHRTKFDQRWGGWYVTGSSGSMRHLGNSVVTDPDKPESMTPLKTKFPSDIVALMVFQHQMHLMNLITRVGWEFRVAASLETATGKRNEVIARQLRDATDELADYLLFVDEVPLTGRIQGSSGFAETFAALGPTDSKGRSLRQFDLERRMMKYPCSYMIYSPAFEALPAAARTSIYERMLQVMSTRFNAEDRQAVIEILRETKKDLPPGLAK